MSKNKKIAIGILLLFMLLLPLIINQYILQIVIMTIASAILGLTFMLSMKVGLPRFDIAGWMGIGAYTSSILMIKYSMSFWPTVLIGGLISAILGWIIYIIPMRRGMITFFVFTMIVSMALFQLFGSLEFFGGWTGTGVVPTPHIGPFQFDGKFSIYYLGLFFTVLVIVVLNLLYKSKIGRAWNAIGSSPKLASSVGVNVVKYRMANVLIGNFIISMVGSYFIVYARAAVPTAFAFGISIMMMMYVVVGGILYSIAGPIIGAIIIAFLPEYLRIADQYASIITSVIIILIVIFMPMGILGLLNMRILPWFYRTKLYARIKAVSKGLLSDSN